MGVTIDSISIEIESSSTDAAKGIDALAKSLEGLKKNGSFKTVSNNLNNLSSALKSLPNVHQASNALRTLANSIEKLKGVGSVASLSNSLKKLPEALKAVSNINLEKIAPQLQRVAEVVAPLSAIKAGGLNTMINSLKKLGDVTTSLDKDTIDAFAEKVALLNSKLGPLSEKMTSIKAGFSAINSGARKASAGVKTLDDSVDTTALNMASFVEIIRGIADAMRGVIQKVTEYIHMASQWDGVKYQFGNTFGEQADIYYEKITQITEALNINKQTFMENAAMAGSMLIGFGVDRQDAREMGIGYTELAYDIWAAFNNVYETLDGADGAMAAVRSAIAGEVEPIRRAGFTIVEATLEQTAANHGLEISLSNATEAQKSYLRYLELVDQAQRKGVVGTYAREMETAEGVMRTFAQQTKTLAQAIGSLFLPILVKVMPYVQAFVELLTEAVHWVAAFFGIEIQDISDGWNDYSSGAMDAVENTNGVTDALNGATAAAKELKNASIGIDELNVISPSSASGGGSGGSGGAGGSGGGGFSGLDIESLWDQSILDGVNNKVDEIKEKLRGVLTDWMPQIQTIGAALGAWTIAKLLGQLGEALDLGDKFHGVVKNIKKLAATAITISLQFKLMEDAFGDFMGEDGTILDYLEGVLIGAASSYLLYKMWGPAGLAIGLGVTATVSLKTVIEEGGVTDMESATVAITGLATAIGAVAIAANELSKAWKAIKASKFIGELGAFISLAKEGGFISALAAAFPKLSTAIAGIPGALSAGASALAAAAPYIAIAAAVVAGITLAFVDYDFSEIGHTVGEKIGSAIRGGVNWIGDIGKGIWEGLKSAFAWLKDALDIDTVWEALFLLFTPAELLRRILPDITELFKGISDWFNEKIENLKGNINEFFGGFFDGLLEGLGLDGSWLDGFSDIFDIEYLDIVEAIVNPFSIGTNIIKGIIDGIKSGDFFEGVKQKFTDFVDKIKEFFGIHSPSTLMRDQIGANLVSGITSGMSLNGIKDRLSSMWSSAKTWWDEKKEALKSYTPSIGNISTKLSSAWESAKTWWNNKKGALKSYTPSIGSIYDKLKERWDNARTWWNDKKTKAKEYTPSIGSIYEKLYARWKNARDWWNNKKGSFKSYTPSIGSITDKLKSAWNSAKNWWNKNVKLSTKLNIQVPTIKVKWDTATAFGKSFKYPTGFSLKFAANGGIFDQGSLIWAGERGPEVMATAAGGKTGVMNVQQMQEAVYEGVYAAMSAAVRGMNGGGSQDVRVYLDGKEISASVRKHQHESGATIMGNEVYSY